MPRACWFVFLTTIVLAVTTAGCGSSNVGDDCASGDVCGAHGTCDDATGDVVCDCDEGYLGERCDACAAGYHDDGAGDCVSDDPCAGTTVCEDLNRGCVDDQGVAVCGLCLEGYTDYGEAECRPEDPCADTTVCADLQRECLNDQGTAVCGMCFAGYTDYGDGECRPSDPCATDTLCASEFRECVNDQGIAECGDCVAGYEDNGGVCVEGCTATSNTGVQVQFDLLLLLDRSASMVDAGKWADTLSGLLNFLVFEAGTGFSLGVQYFPVDPATLPPSNCTMDSHCGLYGPCIQAMSLCAGSFATDTSCEPTDYSPPDMPITAMPGAVTALQASLSGHAPDGSATPIQPALEGVLPDAVSWAQSHPTHATQVVLITDGEPTGCTYNTIAEAALGAQQAANGASPVQTFVIGLGSALGSLDPIAIAGGTGQMYLVNTGGNISQQVQDALTDIRLTGFCRYEIPTAVTSTGDYHLVDVNLIVPGSPSTFIFLTPVADANACDPATGGWYYDDPVAPTEIRLCPASCDAQVQGSADVDILVGCAPSAP